MNKKQNLLAIALSASFVLAGANVAEANEESNVPIQNIGEANIGDTDIENKPDQEKSDANLPRSEEKITGSDTDQGQGETSNENSQKLNDEETSIANTDSVDGKIQYSKDEQTDLASKDDGASVNNNVEEIQDKNQPLSDEAVNESGLDALIDEEKIKGLYGLADDENSLEKSEENAPEAQKAPAESSKEPNYSEDEKNIKDYSDSERYRETDLQPGDTNQESNITDQGEAKDGLEFNIKNPSATSPSKTEYGYQITIDKKTGQRTYTKVYVTDSGLIPVDPGEKPMMDQGEKLTPNSPDVTYKPGENATIDSAGKQRNLNYEASEETLKHINNKDNDFTSFVFKDNYTANNPRVKFFDGNFALVYKVNPWPNENDQLEELKLNKNNYDPTSKYFVQGQDIDTGIKVDNVDENAKERLVGQVYNPITGEIVPGASAYIGDDGNIHVKLPEGALKKDKNGKTVINEDSIFNTPEYNALQNLDVRFFARPRTAEEFRKIAETPDEFGETGTYTGSGAGAADINHKGNNVTIDKQGIDRYDHYNLIGDFKLNLDDTRYYDQSFLDGDNKDTSKNTSSAVKPGVPFDVNMYVPNGARDNEKSAAEMLEADRQGQASGKLIMDFINKENEGKAEKDQWKVELTKGDITKFKITAPDSAKAGDFVAIPVEYTYTNGSKDVHWFHFVVQESDNNKPEYHAEIGFKGDTLTKKPEIPNDEAAQKKNQPKSYELVMPEDGSKYKDSAGNEWTDIKVDPETGEVSAVVPEDADIKGGENLFVDVKVNYLDEDNNPKTEIVKAQFIARPKYQQEVSKEYTSQIPFETKIVYDDTLESGKVIKTEGVVGETKTTFKQVVINGEKGIINDKGEFIKDQEAVEVETIKEKQDAIIRIGTKPAKESVEIPYDTEYKTDSNLKAGETQLVNDGEMGEVTITTSRNDDGTIVINKETTKDAKNKKILIGTKTEGKVVHEEEIPFEYEIQVDPNMETGKYAIVKQGEKGSKTTTWNIVNSETVGEPIVETKDPVKAIIRVGQQKFTGPVTHTITEEKQFTTRIVEDSTLERGTQVVDPEHPGVMGSKTIEITTQVNNGVFGEVTKKLISETKPQEQIIRVGTKDVETTVEKEITEKIPFGVRIEYDSNMIAGTSEVTTPGVPGERTTLYSRKLINGEFAGGLEEKVLNDVNPTDQVIKVGTKVAENKKDYSQEVDVIVKTVENPDLYKGTVNVGEVIPGKVETKVVNKVDPNTGEIVTTEEEIVTKATQIIEVGIKDYEGKFEQEFNKYIPFETEIQYDDEMMVGEYKIVQKGITGEKKQTVSQTYKNGELGKKQFSDEVVVTEPQKQIIKVGRKVAENTTEIKKEVGTKIEYIYDDTLELGELILGDFTQAKVETKLVQKYNPKTGKIEVEEETIVTPGVQKIVVGRKKTDNTCPAPVLPEHPENPQPGEKPETPSETPEGSDESVNEEENPNEPGSSNENPETPENPDDNPDKDRSEGKDPNPSQTSDEDHRDDEDYEDEIKETESKADNKKEIKEKDSDELSIKEKAKGAQRQDKLTNPKTGIGSIAPIFTSIGISIAGLLATKKKKKEYE